MSLSHTQLLQHIANRFAMDDWGVGCGALAGQEAS